MKPPDKMKLNDEPAIYLFAWSVIIFMIFNALDILSNKIIQSMQVFREWGMKVLLIIVLNRYRSKNRRKHTNRYV